jgi:membrane-associated phospholipid phosphatase
LTGTARRANETARERYRQAWRDGRGARRRAAALTATLAADPLVRLGLGISVVLATAVAARGQRVGRSEARAFHVINALPDGLYAPAWTVMQLGSLGAVPAAAAAAAVAHDRPLAGRLLASGSATWALSKLVKRTVDRPRPAALLAGVRVRGAEATGLGYLSGHTGVVVALAAAAGPRLRPPGPAVALGIVPAVSLARVYVGAHLPLDILGGAGLGMAVEAAVELLPGRGGVRPAAGSR